MRLYLAGKMRGVPYLNFPEFDTAAAALREAGFDVFSPAEHDRDVYGAEFEKAYPTGKEEGDFDLRAALKADTTYICLQADGIALLPGWGKSSGARAEKALAEALGLPCKSVDEWLHPVDIEAPSVVSEKRVKDAAARIDPDYPIPYQLTGETRSVSATGGEKGVKLARYDLIPTEPLRQLAEHYGKGAQKYEDRNYERGYEWSKSYAALQRHANAFWSGETWDPETGSNHMVAVAWHALALVLFCEKQPGYDDRPGVEPFRNVSIPTQGWTN